MTAQHGPSPNHGARQNGLAPALVILHYTAMPDTGAVVDWLCNPASQVSAHYVISPQGAVIQLVDETRRAWHAGAASWGGQGDVNSVSIGVELVNDGQAPFSAALMEACTDLLSGVMARWGLGPAQVLGHSDVAPGRKIDPGLRFDWRRLARQGLAVWPKADAPAEGGAETFVQALRAIGYTAEVPPEVLLAAFRARVRPWAQGPLDGWDIAYAQDLAHRYPVDESALCA